MDCSVSRAPSHVLDALNDVSFLCSTLACEIRPSLASKAHRLIRGLSSNGGGAVRTGVGDPIRTRPDKTPDNPDDDHVLSGILGESLISRIIR